MEWPVSGKTSRSMNQIRSQLSFAQRLFVMGLFLGYGWLASAAHPNPTNNLLGQLPVAFEANDGRTDRRAQFVMRAPGYTSFFNEREVAFSFHHVEPEKTEARRERQRRGEHRLMEHSDIRMTLLGAQPKARLIGEESLPGVVHQLVGADPAKWHRNIPTYARLTTRDIYRNIDLTYYGNAQSLEYDFIVRPGGDPAAIRLGFEGTSGVEITPEGQLRLRCGPREVAVWHTPVAYQMVNGARQDVVCHFVALDRHEIGFAPGAYDRNLPLTIDPVLLYSTYFGASGADSVEAITVGPTGEIFLVGETTSLNFPAAGYRTAPYQSNDVFVAKLTSNGANYLFSTYFGGSGDDFGNAIAVDSSNTVFIAGSTDSPDFPIQGGHKSYLSGEQDAFFARFTADGNALYYSTYLGGSNYNSANALALGPGGTVFIAGETDSGSSFPKKNAFQASPGGGLDGFVARYNPTLSSTSSLVMSSWLGGADDERISAIVADATFIYVAGEVDSLDSLTSTFPVKNAFQSTYGGGGSDAFIAKINPGAATVSWATLLGGIFEDTADAVAIDSAANVYVAGTTDSDDFPTVNPQQASIAGPLFFTPDAFVAKFSASGSSLLYSTYFGGDASETARGLAVDTSGLIYLLGNTDSTNLPVTEGAFQAMNNGGGDVFVARLNPAASGPNGIIFATYYGGSGREEAGLGNSLFLNTSEEIYITGLTTSTDGLPLAGPYAPYQGGYSDSFLAKLAFEPDLSVSVTGSVSTVLVGSNLVYTARVVNSGKSNYTSVLLTNLLPATMNFVSISVTRGSYTRTNQTIYWNIGTLTNRATAVLTVTVTATEPGPTTNFARVTAAETELNNGNNRHTLITPVRGFADLVLTQTTTPSPASTVSNINYTLLVSNRGPYKATQVELTDYFPASTFLSSVSSTRGTVVFANNILTCSVPELTNGGTFTVSLKLRPIDFTTLTNTASVTAYESDTATNNNASTTITRVTLVSELALNLFASASTIYVGSTVTYTVTFVNYGPNTATNVALTNFFPAQVTFQSATISTGSWSQITGGVRASIPALPTNQIVTLSIVARGAAAGADFNDVILASAYSDPVPGDNAASLPLTVLPVADLSIGTGTSPSSNFMGLNFTCTAKMTNAGPSPIEALLTVTLPSGVTALSATSAYGGCVISGTNVICGPGLMASGANGNATLVLTTTTPGQKSVTFNISSSALDPFPTNNTRSTTLRVIDLPALNIRRSLTNVVLSWPTTPTGFVAEYLSPRMPATNWRSVTNPIITTNGVKTFTNRITGTNTFYRLRKP